jgi:hypothetical protein
MRDSDMAIGGLVLLGIVGAFAYFLFPNFITRILRAPSYTEIIQAQEREIAAFNHETKIVFSYLTGSWTMKIYHRLDSVVGRGGYEDWIRIVKVERDEVISDSLQNVERQRQIADRLALSLASKKAIRDRTKESIFKLSKSPLDSDIEALQVELDKKRNELSQLLGRFSESRRHLNEKALREWFHRSLLVGLLAAVSVTLSCVAILLIRSSSSAKIVPISRKPAVPNPLSFASKAPRQSGLIKAVESPVLADSAFYSTVEPELGPVPPPIASAFGQLPRTNTALKLASILGGYPDTPASSSHHLSDPGGLIIHTAKVLGHSEPLISLLPDPRIGPVVILAHDIGKVLTLSNQGEGLSACSAQAGRPHDIPSADLLASLAELREEFDEITARSMILAIRHQHSKAEIPLNAPPLTQTILQFIKKADLGASAEESREAAEKMRELAPRVIDAFPYIIPELNVNGCMGGKAEGYLSDGYLFLFKEPVKEKLLSHLDTRNAPVFKGQDPVWNEMALALAGAGLITTQVAAKEAGKKSCLFTIKTSQGQEKAIAIPVSNLAPHLTERWLQANIPKIEVV